MNRKTTPLLLLAALALALGVAACGSGSDTKGSGASASGNAVDRAFVAQMVPHHQMAVEMAGIAAQQGQRKEITGLSDEITRAQTDEIGQLKAVAKRLGVEIKPMSMDGTVDHGSMGADAKTLGLSMDDMGMGMDMAALKTAKPFDRQFIDDMIPHHQGAIRMARAELAKGSDPELKTLATAIIDAQTREIEEMNAWRKDWYGAESPAGGVPAV